LAANNDGNNRRLGSVGACEAVVAALKRHFDTDVDLAEQVTFLDPG
jgi:hypothetical protein